MKIQHILASFALALLAASCTEKEIEVPDNSVRDYTLGVTNDNYTATTVLDGIGNTRIVEVLNQPAWVSEVKREDNLLGGSMVLAVTVKSDPSLEDIRSAHLSIKMSNGATANLEVTQRAGLPVGFNADESPSVNVDFEADWSSAMSVKLVTSVQTINGRDQVITEDTPLPWNDTDPGTKCNVPDDVIESMLNHKDNWLLAFNTTGITRASCVNMNYFGLYNVSTGLMRIFYYWPASIIPESGANDHLWFVRFKGKQAEHNSTQFAIPLNHRFQQGTESYSKFETKAGTYYTTAYSEEMTPKSDYVVVPKIGWWAFDVDLSAMRAESFFDNYQQITIGMDLFDTQNIILNSLIKGSLDGTLTGDMNLKALLPASANDAGKITPAVMSAVNSFMTNKFVLDYFFGGGSAAINVNANGGGGNAGEGGNAVIVRPRLAAGIGVAVVAVGSVLSLVGNLTKEYGKEGGASQDVKEKLGHIDGKISLDLNATMKTQGLIKSQRSHKVPEVSIPKEYLRNLTGATKTKAEVVDLQIGNGLWNITDDPVVYIVKDAYWANKPQATYYSRKDVSWYRSGQERAEYDISMSPYQLGMRLISFFDPTSIGNVQINEALFGHPSELNVAVSYGVYPGSEAGYSDWFREATDMQYNPLTLSTSAKNQKVSTGNVAGAAKAPFRVFKAPYNKDLFKIDFNNPYPETIATRLSEQSINGEKAYARRYYGSSIFYCDPKATYSTVDRVQYVTAPQIFIPYDESRRVITDPDIPDLVVTVTITINSQGPLESEPTWKMYTLRYVPKVQFIGYKDVKGIADKIVAKSNGGLPSSVNYITYEVFRDIARSYSNEITAQLAQ